MRRLILIGLALASSASQAQVWEKFLLPGLSYRMEADAKTVRTIHVLRFNLGAPGLRMQPEVAGGRVYAGPDEKGRETVTKMVLRTGAVAGINADFFPFTGDPLGAMVTNGDLISRPDPRRMCFGWGANGSSFGRLAFTAQALLSAGEPITITGINEECPDQSVTLFTPGASVSLSAAPNTAIIFKDTATGPWRPTGQRILVADQIVSDQTRIEVPAGGAILVARGTRALELKRIKAGDRVVIDLATTGFDWKRITNVISGGPNLVSRGFVNITAAEEGFKEGFITNAHPRTAIGRTAQGQIVAVCVDGRQEMSGGLPLVDLAALMIRLGCTEAMNLDGGGSTTMNVFGLTVNRPSDGIERPIANGLIWLSDGARRESAADPRILAPAFLAPTDSAVLALQDAEGKPIPNGDVIWAAQGDGWIDQSGTLHGLKAGVASVSAAARGRIVSIKVPIKAGP